MGVICTVSHTSLFTRTIPACACLPGVIMPGPSLHSQECPSLDEKLYSHHAGYKRHPKNVLAVSLPVILTTCKRLLRPSLPFPLLPGQTCGGQHAVLLTENLLAVPGGSEEGTGIPPRGARGPWDVASAAGTPHQPKATGPESKGSLTALCIFLRLMCIRFALHGNVGRWPAVPGRSRIWHWALISC